MVGTGKLRHNKRRRHAPAGARRWPAGLKIALFAAVVDLFSLIVALLEFFFELLKK
jgi:hypothetical protein